MNPSVPEKRTFRHGETLELEAVTTLKALDEVILVLPAGLLAASDRIGGVILGNDDMKFRTTEDGRGNTVTIEVWLQPGMALRLTKSCEVMMMSATLPVAPVSLEILRPQ